MTSARSRWTKPLFALVGAVALALPAVATGPAQAHQSGAAVTGAGPQAGPGKQRSCDSSGDLNLKNDCVLHRAVNGAIDNSLRAHQRFQVQVGVDGSLQGRLLRTRVQLRPTGAQHAQWRTRATKTWRAVGFDTRVRVRAPGRGDMFAMRTKTTVVQPTRSSGRVQAADMSTAMWSQSSSVGVGKTCPTSPDDDQIIEYFNEAEFEGGFSLLVQDLGVQFAVTLVCPDSLAPTDFGINLVSADLRTQVACNAAINVPKTQLKQGSVDFCVPQAGGDPSCDFMIVVFNASTNAVFSQTHVQVALPDGIGTSLIPQLSPATLPICNNVPQECELSGTCALSPKPGSLSLCSSGSSCLTPYTGLPPAGYSYNNQVYFQTSLVEIDEPFRS